MDLSNCDEIEKLVFEALLDENNVGNVYMHINTFCVILNCFSVASKIIDPVTQRDILQLGIYAYMENPLYPRRSINVNICIEPGTCYFSKDNIVDKLSKNKSAKLSNIDFANDQCIKLYDYTSHRINKILLHNTEGPAEVWSKDGKAIKETYYIFGCRLDKEKFTDDEFRHTFILEHS